MSLLPRIRPQLRLWFRRSAVETELDAEVQAFYTTLVDRLVRKALHARRRSVWLI